MTVIGKSSYAYFFDGVTDSIIIPQGTFSDTGQELPDGTKTPADMLSEKKQFNNTLQTKSINSKRNNYIGIEAWVMPDCGGVIASCDGQFKLELGTVDTPGPATFTVHLHKEGGEKIVVTTTTALDKTTRWDGIVYPSQEVGGIHDSYNRFNTGTYPDATNLNLNHRPLIHVVAGINASNVYLYVNGDLVARQPLPLNTRVVNTTNPTYIGGKGGEFRGIIEGIQFTNGFDGNLVKSEAPLLSAKTNALYRFEEPIDVIDGEYEFNAFSAAADGSTTAITVSAADAQSLIAKLTGKAYDASTPETNFLVSPYSMGSYKVIDYKTSPGSTTTHDVKHTPYNILINPGSINRNTKKPNQKPPERLRVHKINGNTGVITVSSIHIDFSVSSPFSNSLRGILHSRTANVDNYFVVVGADLLVDNGTGKPYQPPHYATQIFDKTGQMVIDESNKEQHALVYSSNMATTTNNPNNPFAVTWPSSLDSLYQIGHSGRHCNNHVTGHEYMSILPKENTLLVDQSINGSSDIIDIVYNTVSKGIESLLPTNMPISAYEEITNAEILTIKNSSYVDSGVRQHTANSKDGLLAIGGVGFHFPAFALKGPMPSVEKDINLISDEIRKYHLRPEVESRIALLKVPTLSTAHNLAPYVEVHYNAIDLTGASMGVTHPMLIVEKTVPAGNHVLTGSTTVIDVIMTDLADANKDTTLFSAGGEIELKYSKLSDYFLTDHSLIGDNSGGIEDDDELDESRTPVNYTPIVADEEVRLGPQNIEASHTTSKHKSVFNRMVISTKGTQLIDTFSNDTTTSFMRQPITENTGTGVFDVGPVSSKSNMHEVFDIIDNRFTGTVTSNIKIIVQPSNRKRSNQLSRVYGSLQNTNDTNDATLYHIMSRGKIRSVITEQAADGGLYTKVRATGIVDSANARSINKIGAGSPDSHIVKEIEPNAPVVTVTLGGPGQGAVNTKPTFDPSPLMRLPWSTRRTCAVQATGIYPASGGAGLSLLSIQPLNNGGDIESWGTYCFPKKGRVYLDSGASAEYEYKVGNGFAFNNTDALASRKFLSEDGKAYATMIEWSNAVGLTDLSSPAFSTISNFVYNDPHFDYDTLCQDGSTVNDRLFQSMDTISHDYQLGTQFANTRAMVEIPVFPQQFFPGTYGRNKVNPGPDNSMKLRLDATYTAHTWNPTPVGRRCEDVIPGDKTAFSAYAYDVANQAHIKSALITKVEKDGTKHKIYVSNPNLFPKSNGSTLDNIGNLKNIQRYRRAFLPTGEWIIYENDPSSDGYLEATENLNLLSQDFLSKAKESIGSSIFVSGDYQSETLIPIASDITTPSSDYENRSPYYYDIGNMQTQGGNLDYGLRQYVSAVEFKAGPKSNPHASRTTTKRAEATINSVQYDSTTQIIFLSVDDATNFPDIELNGTNYEQGEKIYVAEIMLDTPIEFYYLSSKLLGSSATKTPNIISGILATGVSITPADLVDVKVRLKKVGRAHVGLSAPATANTSIENRACTFFPSTSAEQWFWQASTGAGSATTLTISHPNFTSTGVRRLLFANTIGFNLRPGDEVYKQTGTGDILYVGKIAHLNSAYHNGLSGIGGYATVTLEANNAVAITAGDKIRVGINSVMEEDPDAILNRTWLNPYAQGGLRNGDTIWANMTLNNPHAIEGLFAKSRGVFNDGQVWKGFNGGQGSLAASRPRKSIPLENFLIGDTCLETAQNYVQHVNKTIELNYESLGLDASQAPTIAYVDPYQSTDEHARVLLYDVAHDREFIAFHDLHMQVQSSPATPVIGQPRTFVYDTGTIEVDKFLGTYNGGAPHYLTTQIDVANGFPTENKYLRETQQSKFIESAYSHNIANNTSDDGAVITGTTTNSQAAYLFKDPSNVANNAHIRGKGHGHIVYPGLFNEQASSKLTVGDSNYLRTQTGVCKGYWGNIYHAYSRKEVDSKTLPLIHALRKHRNEQTGCTFRDPSTLFDTPDGTRVITAFLCLKGKRSNVLDLANHEESRLQHLDHWTKMDFVRRLEIDFGEVAVKKGVTDIEAAAREIVRLINQAGAENGRSHARRPSHQYPGETERLDLTRIGIRQDIISEEKDPAGVHINADFAATGSTYDPSPWWFDDLAFDSHDRGSHMGYLRAHLGRVVEDSEGMEGFTIVIHSTIPGASGRNFCVWLDNSKGQSPYKPQFLIGHGGRYRNFWCQPDEIMGENMHPAPMPLNKHGRPFAPITSLREYVISDKPNTILESNNDFSSRNEIDNNATTRFISANAGSGLNANTVNAESFEPQSASTTLVEGLRTGTSAVGRINFGGIVEAGIPGFAPDTGSWGFGQLGDDRFDNIYGEPIKEGATSKTLIQTYGNYVPPSEVGRNKIGNSDIYGLRFTDHRGKGYGVRYIYRTMDKPFTNDNSILPPTIDDEVCIYFDDRDVNSGGFTIGNHMQGWGDATGRIDMGAVTHQFNSWRGNKWRGVPAPNIGIDCTADWDASANTFTVVLQAPFDTSGTEFDNSEDILGYLGFPKEEGLIQLNEVMLNTAGNPYLGSTFSYSGRTTNGKAGPHIFYGVRGDASGFVVTHKINGSGQLQNISQNWDGGGSTTAIRVLISPVLNWTTLITDELIAAATVAAINSENITKKEGIIFDCTKMYAADGRTFGEWGVRPEAIKIRAHNINNDKLTPLSDMFRATLHRDWGIHAAHLEFGEYEKITQTNGVWGVTKNTTLPPSTDAEISNHKSIDTGYLPRTVIQITTFSKGYHSNTPTPILVDSNNDPAPIKKWRQNLKGQRFLHTPGDHILPNLNNGIMLVTTTTDGSARLDITPATISSTLIPAGQEGGSVTMGGGGFTATKVPSYGQLKKLWMSDEAHALCQSENGANSLHYLNYDVETQSTKWESLTDNIGSGPDNILLRFGDVDLRGEICGYRIHGSVDSEPVIFFRGGKDSVDHSVPLYFGGGFSGVILDINDGTQNDYADFYTHPYSTGPTGVTGIQNANEISTSFAMVDCNAILAFFPGTSLLNQHRASAVHPVANKDSILSKDIDDGNLAVPAPYPYPAKYAAGMVYQRPSPLILRFAHPHARYDDHITQTENKTTYIIFGPGQSFPWNETAANNAEFDPNPGHVITTGNTWSKVPYGVNLPNEINNDAGHYGPFTSTYQSTRQRFHWHDTFNWEPPQGIPNTGSGGHAAGLEQRPEDGRSYGRHFTNNVANPITPANLGDFKKAHPYKHCAVAYYGVAMSADMTWHMDGGYAPGGNWLDNQLTFNTPHKVSDYRVSTRDPDHVHPTSFRVSGAMAQTWLVGDGSPVVADMVDTEYIVVDATRCQNGEELATVLGQSINEHPGGGALKALGGTFLPSMGNSARQDRYGWVELEYLEYNFHHGGTVVPTVHTDPALNLGISSVFVRAKLSTNTQAAHEQIPQSGWIRTDLGGRDPDTSPVVNSTGIPTFAPYHSREVLNIGGTWQIKFYLAPNRLTGYPLLEDLHTFDDLQNVTKTTFPIPGAVPAQAATKVFVWSKAGVNRYQNTFDGTRGHMAQVHFSGLVDAIDRTRPAGAVGWAGERYSYLNTLKIGTEGYAAGLGAWHSMLGFSPYGKASSCMSVLGNLPAISPMPRSPEATPRIDGHNQVDTLMRSAYAWHSDLASGSYPYAYTFQRSHNDMYFNWPTYITNPRRLDKELQKQQGVFSRGFLVVSYESELPLIAKKDRDGITATGDWLAVTSKDRDGVAAATAITFAGTTQWSERIHNSARFTAPANAGPNVEALIAENTAAPTGDVISSAYKLHNRVTADIQLYNAEPCFAKTGDLFFDLDESPGSINLQDASDVERNLTLSYAINSGESYIQNLFADDDYWLGDINGFKQAENSPIKNFSIEHIVWKRMDGGNLSMPAVNARGLGALPFTTRVLSNTPYKTGEKIFGNCRFSFETTNSAMFPIIQAQELAHPQLASRHPDEMKNVLEIPNEEMQFEEMLVTDDTGQTHVIEGGSPFGTIIRTFNTVSDRSTQGLAPSIANSGVEPNFKIQLPNPDSIPGNIIVRSGFDRLQAYQTETMGSGGMLHPGVNSAELSHIFTKDTEGPRLGPTFGNHNWEHISQRSAGEAFPDITKEGWKESTSNSPLDTSYELHDRALYFHITKSGNTHSHKHPVGYDHNNGVINGEVTASSFAGTTLTASATINAATQTLYSSNFGDRERVGQRRFLRIYDPTTDRGGVASYTNISGATFTGIVGDADFDAIVKDAKGTAGELSAYKIVPSYYIPAGSTRFYAARRLRDHCEVSGNSPDMAHTTYLDGLAPDPVAQTMAYDIYKKPKLTPMAIPRMGHHYVTPTMAMLPGHWAHPAYQGLFYKHYACRSSSIPNFERNLIEDANSDTSGHASAGVYNYLKADLPTSTTDQITGFDPVLHFSGLTATPSGPSDIHGGAFTLMFESKVRSNGYGVLASEGQAGVINASGGHSIVLEGAFNYTLEEHFPNPSEVGAYQIVIQPNLHTSQLIGFHANGPTTDLPDGTVNQLTGQQTALVIGVKSQTATGGYTLVLAEATMADVRGCEVFINELMIDLDPDAGSQFTNLPPLMLHNPLGIQSSEAPAFTRRSLPYHKGMFVDTSPGMTTNIPWWSIMHKVGPDDVDSAGYRHLSHHRVDNYYEFLRAGAGSVASQITLAGYPSIYPDLYSEVLENISLNPVCTVKAVASTLITVDDARGFPHVPYYGMVLEYTDANGVRRTHEYTMRSGYDTANMNEPKSFTITAKSSFTSNLTVGTKLRLSRAYDFRPAGKIFTESKTSIVTRTLPQTLQGNRDTNSLHLADAYVCLWHPNLGRPHTFYSDSSRTWLNPLTDRAIDQKPYNSMPEHYETIHYHDASYYTSLGPFGFQMKTPTPPTNTNRYVTSVSSNTITTNRAFTDFALSCNTNNTAGSGSTFGSNPKIIQTASTATLIVGMEVSGTGIASGSVITQIDSATLFRVDLNTTGTATVSVTFSPKAINDGAYISVGGQMLGVVIPSPGTPGDNKTVINTLGVSQSVRVGAEVFVSGDGSVSSANDIDNQLGYGGVAGRYNHQGGQSNASDATTKTMLNKYWPSGSRGGPISSKLEGYAYVSTSWSYPRAYDYDGPVWQDADDDGSYVVSSGITKVDYSTLIPPQQTFTTPYGYRFSLHQPYNKPQWGLYGVRALRELALAFTDATCDTNHTSGLSDGSSTNVRHITMDSTAKLKVGMAVSGTGIPAGATVTAINNATCFTLSAATTATNTNTTLSFTPTDITVGYKHGPLIQLEGRGSNGWNYAGGSGLSDVNFTETFVGIMERQTNFSGMLGVDKPEWQVRYSNGMRMTRPFGCPVRTLRNKNTVLRDWWGDSEGKSIVNIEDAVSYYLVDWWGNTRGEDVRRYPMRGFGIRPAWDAGDVYEYDRTNDKTPWLRVLNGGVPLYNVKGIVDVGTTRPIPGPTPTIPRFAGRLNDLNNDNPEVLVDVFQPTNANRIGDMGNGRGVRYPTQFNEDILTALDEPIRKTGLVLSHNTAEPNTNKGFIRARNDVLQNNEIPRGISGRLGIDEDGLLKPEAVVSDRAEVIDGDSPHKDAISRSSPRIGIDAANIEGTDSNIIAINTEAHSLHTDRNVGQRVILHGGMQTGSQTLGDYDLTALTFAGQPQGGVMRLSHTSNFNPLGGTYIAETRNYVSPIDDTNWGKIPTSGMVLWLKANELDLADGAAVSSWKDTSGNGHEFVQATSSKQPTFVLSESSFNNMPAVRFDGGDSLGLPFNANLNTNQFTIFVVPAVSSDTNAPEMVIDNSTSPSSTSKGFAFAADMRNSGGANNWEMFAGIGTSSYPNISAGTDSVSVSGAPSILVGQISGGNGAGATATQLFRVNGVQIGTSSVGYHKDTGETYHAGAGDNATTYELNGEIAEVIQFNRALTTTEIQQVEGYLAEKYGITASSSTRKSSNPYATSTVGVDGSRANVVDKSVTYMLRPVRVLDKNHVEIFRPNTGVAAGLPQEGSTYFSATAGGKYGLYVYETTNGRASTGSYIRASNPDTNPPYVPAYYMDISASDTVPMSQGPKIKGTEVTGFDKTKLDNEVTRIIISENTLQHYRADASRRRAVDESDEKEKRKDFTVKPRFSQSLHPKGHKGDVTFSTNDHSGDAA